MAEVLRDEIRLYGGGRGGGWRTEGEEGTHLLEFCHVLLLSCGHVVIHVIRIKLKQLKIWSHERLPRLDWLLELLLLAEILLLLLLLLLLRVSSLLLQRERGSRSWRQAQRRCRRQLGARLVSLGPFHFR